MNAVSITIVKGTAADALQAACLLAMLTGVAPLAGCGDGRPARVPVSGQVLIDGKPLALGNIRFVPTGGRPSSGKVGTDGRFTLMCYDGEDGAIPGTHRVAVSAGKIISESKMQWFAPKKYADFRTSGLEVTVSEPTDDVKIELKWDGGKPFIE